MIPAGHTHSCRLARRSAQRGPRPGPSDGRRRIPWRTCAWLSTSAGRSPTSASSTRRAAPCEVAKVPSTADPIEGVLAGVKEAGVDLARRRRSSPTARPWRRTRCSRGGFPPAAMVTTKGFRDVIEIRRGTKDDLWDAYKDVAPPYIRRRDRSRWPSGSTTPGAWSSRARRGRGAPRRGDPAQRGASRRSPSASSTPTRTRRTSAGCGRSSRRSCPGSRSRPRARSCRRSSSTSASRPRSRTPSSRRSSAATCSGSASGSREGGYEGDLLLLHSGGGVMTPAGGRAARRPPRRLGDRRRRHRQPPPRRPVRLRERDRPRHGRDEHGHLARLRRRGADDEGVVRRVRLPDLLPVDRGADDRRGRRLARVDRRGRLAAQRAAVGGRRPRPGLLRPRERAADEHGRQPRSRAPRRAS